MRSGKNDHGRPAVPHRVTVPTRREFLRSAGAGFGALALASLLEGDGALGAGGSVNPLTAKKPDFPAKAKNVIWVFIDGGPSHIDLFDPKPKVNELAGKPLPDHIERVITPMGVTESPILACKRKWKQHGECGAWVSDWLPHIAECVDDLAIIRSCVADGLNHVGSVCQMNTGSILAGRPSLGSWVTYGLGTENQSLPAFVVLCDNKSDPPGGPRCWSTGFMEATYQGTKLASSDEPIANLHAPAEVGDEQQQRKLALLAELNRQHAEPRDEETELEARIRSYELAFRMQAEAPAAIDLERETEETRNLYGMDDEKTASMGRNCLLARRLVERGVRFVQLYSGSGSKWDAHSNIEGNHSGNCRAMDKPVAGLLNDLKRRGLLDETLVVWGGEFGRTPMSEKGTGRDHNPYGFTMWMAGGGIRGGQVIGKTDEVGLHAIEDRAHVHDLHATILAMMGLDHLSLTWIHNGRKERPTINQGAPVEQILG